MNKENLELLIEAYNKDTEKLTKLVKAYVRDKKNPLEDRWKLFCDSDLGDHQTYIISWDYGKIEKLYDSDYFSKYETIFIEDHLIDILWDLFTDKHGSEECWSNKEELKKLEEQFEIEISPFKEEVLSKFIKSYTFDW